MDELQQEIVKTFGNRLRLRVCGICLQDESILMINHRSVGEKGELWVPPGGGMNFGEDAAFTLKREFQEETGLDIQVGKLLFVHEFLELPLHAIELFFMIKSYSGKLSQGTDPEMKKDQQIIKDIRFLPIAQLEEMDPLTLHQCFRNLRSVSDLLSRQGYLLNGRSRF